MSVLLYIKQLKDLEVLIRFLRFPECPLLLHCVEHSVAILSLVLVRETDDRQLSVIMPHMISMATPIASEQLVLYYTVILFYYIILIHQYG